ncbi:HipA domain-containing protein [Lysinibacter cavernae]|uniref:HipA domain-containing protein n=1 Tax=Lysinibacter cavernae TaxID=1640652 RepID=UPI003605D8B0
MRQLDVYLDGHHIGELNQTSAGATSFSYDDVYAREWNSTPLSLSMPLERTTHKGKPVNAFIKGLLPDSPGRLNEIGKTFGVNPNNPVALLEHVGSDAAGAVQILPHGQESADAAERRGDLNELDSKAFAEEIREIVRNNETWGVRAGQGRWSLPGAQPKIALFRGENGNWAVPNDSTPTTHILKPSVPPLSDHHINEFMTMAAAKNLGLNVADQGMIETELGDFVYVTARYDREIRDGKWVRLHQEDFCQALSVQPDKKYQEEGGPSIRNIATLFRSLPQPEDQKSNAKGFFDALVFNVAMQGTDAHAKNYSLMLRGQSAKLAPLYDLASHAPYTAEGLKLSMSMNDEYLIDKVGQSNFISVAKSLGLDETYAVERSQFILSNTADAYDAAAREANEIVGKHPFVAKLTDSIATYAKKRGWLVTS